MVFACEEWSPLWPFWVRLHVICASGAGGGGGGGCATAGQPESGAAMRV